MIIGQFGFDKDGKIYGLLYAEPFKDWNTGEIKADWALKFYASERSRKRGIKLASGPGRPVFLFELTIKQLAQMGHPLPYVPDEKQKGFKSPNDFLDRTIFKANKGEQDKGR
jgi:hypothetical protein